MRAMSIAVGVDPIAFTVGTFDIRWYGIMVVLAVLVIIVWVWRASKTVGLSGEFVLGAAPWAIIAAVIVSRLIHVIDRLDLYASNPRAILGVEGMTVYGAILGAMLGTWIYCRVRRVPFGPLADVAAPGVILAQAVGRVGCTLNGCCYGRATSLPWAFVYSNPDSFAPLGIAVHPTMVYELLWDLAVFALLFWVFRGHLRPKGSLFGVYLALYSAGAFGIRFLRGDTHAIFAGVHEGQIIALAILVITVPLLVWKTRWTGKPEEPDETSVGGPSSTEEVANGSTSRALPGDGGT
ncbi:MAG: prolipoprotein diacylglyceryl transferase [Chloroflexota bacterium]|nr:prolipoprotein diacylglyceryl transferase [Chloroflexota bacterium]